MNAKMYYNCWWLFWTDGFTVWRWIFFRRNYENVSSRLERHELKHVEQWERYGWLGFLVRYVYQWIRYGYMNMPLEIEAKKAEAE